jgi:hypothetical protein
MITAVPMNAGRRRTEEKFITGEKSCISKPSLKAGNAKIVFLQLWPALSSACC